MKNLLAGLFIPLSLVSAANNSLNLEIQKNTGQTQVVTGELKTPYSLQICSKELSVKNSEYYIFFMNNEKMFYSKRKNCYQTRKNIRSNETHHGKLELSIFLKKLQDAERNGLIDQFTLTARNQAGKKIEEWQVNIMQTSKTGANLPLNIVTLIKVIILFILLLIAGGALYTGIKIFSGPKLPLIYSGGIILKSGESVVLEKKMEKLGGELDGWRGKLQISLIDDLIELKGQSKKTDKLKIQSLPHTLNQGNYTIVLSAGETEESHQNPALKIHVSNKQSQQVSLAEPEVHQP